MRERAFGLLGQERQRIGEELGSIGPGAMTLLGPKAFETVALIAANPAQQRGARKGPRRGSPRPFHRFASSLAEIASLVGARHGAIE